MVRTPTECRRTRAGLVTLLVLVAVGAVPTTAEAAPDPKVPTPVVDWERTTLVGGADRLVVAERRPDVRTEKVTYRILALDPRRGRWTRRPDAHGVPQVVPGGLVTVYLRCGPPRGELGNRRCDVVVATLADGTRHWRARTVSRHREWVHEVYGVTPVAVAGPEAVFGVTRSTSLQLAVGLHSVRRLPLPPVLEGAGVQGAQLVREPRAGCIAGRRWWILLGDGQVSNGLGPGVTWVTSLDLTGRSPSWSRPRRSAIDDPSWTVTYGCRRTGPLAFLPPRTLEWTGRRWRTWLPAGTPGPAHVTQGVVDAVAAVAQVTGSASGLWFLAPSGFTPVPADVRLHQVYQQPNLVRLGPVVVGLTEGATGPVLRVLRPGT